MRAILAMPKVLQADTPRASAMTLFLFDAENAALRTLAKLVEEKGLHILSYVFDGVYVLAKSLDDAKRVFKLVARSIFISIGLRIAMKDVHGSKLSVFVPVPVAATQPSEHGGSQSAAAEGADMASEV